MPDGGKKTMDAGLPISKESRVVLGLEPSGAVRTVAQTGRMTLLETGDSRQVSLPSDRDLVLSSDVGSFALADVLNSVHYSGKSGLLLFEFQHDEKAVYVSRGEAVFAASNLPAGRIHFWEGKIEPDNVVRLSLPTKKLIGEGLARSDELKPFMAMIEDARTRIRPVSPQRPAVVGCWTPSNSTRRSLSIRPNSNTGHCDCPGIDFESWMKRWGKSLPISNSN